MAADYRTMIGIVRDFVEEFDRIDMVFEGAIGEIIKRSRVAIEPSKPKNDPEKLHFQLDDACCKMPFAKAAAAGKLDTAEEWACPKCGTLWAATTHEGGSKSWTPVLDVGVFKL